MSIYLKSKYGVINRHAAASISDVAAADDDDYDGVGVDGLSIMMMMMMIIIIILIILFFFLLLLLVLLVC